MVSYFFWKHKHYFVVSLIVHSLDRMLKTDVFMPLEFEKSGILKHYANP
jgi:hypothetical protein